MGQPGRTAPGPEQESIWDYPRPPRVEDTNARVRVEVNGVTIADCTPAKRVLEMMSHPPVYNIPLEDIAMEHLRRSKRASVREVKAAPAPIP